MDKPAWLETKHFNTAGPIEKEDHYVIEPLDRIDLREILTLLHRKKYFVLHAPRQTGKTSYLLALMKYLNHEGSFKCLYVNLEKAQAAGGNVKAGLRTILQTLAGNALKCLEDAFLNDRWKEIFQEAGEYSCLHEALDQWCVHSDKPIVLFLDEVDSLIGDTLISLLRQVRTGYPDRPGRFPQSIVLCGVRDVRDYRIQSSKEKEIITGGSAFNIKAASLRLSDFSRDEIKALYEQHTHETGQVFNPGIYPLVWELTEGQPWLVNALAFEACFKSAEGKNRDVEITKAMFHHAKENLILRRETHLDQLMDKLAEERVRRVIGPLLAGSVEAETIPPDDVNYVEDLGLIRKYPQLRIANRIYQEIIPRELTVSTQLTIHQESSWYTDSSGKLDMDKLLTAFQAFFRKHFESWVEGFDYKEAGSQLLLQAFLQRVINGGGTVEREYGLGRERTDLLVIWPHKEGKQEIVIELKLRYDSLDTTIAKGLKQTWKYMDKCDNAEGYLLIFERTEKPWEEKIFKRTGRFNNTDIPIYGM